MSEAKSKAMERKKNEKDTDSRCSDCGMKKGKCKCDKEEEDDE